MTTHDVASEVDGIDQSSGATMFYNTSSSCSGVFLNVFLYILGENAILPYFVLETRILKNELFSF